MVQGAGGLDRARHARAAGDRDAGTARAGHAATKEELEGFFHHLEGELDQAGFYKTPEKRPGMVRNMRNLFQRAGLTEQEVRSLRGMVASLPRPSAAKQEDRG